MVGCFIFIFQKMMRSCLCHLLFLILYSFATNAQDSYVKDPAICIHFILNDFKTADYIRSHSLSAALRNNEFAKIKNLKSGLAISYLQGISPHFDLSVSLAGAYLDYTLHNGTELGKGKLLLETDAALTGKLFTDRHFMTPYLSAGFCVSKYYDYYGLLIPVGFGLQMNFSDKAYLLMNGQYRVGLTNKVNSHFVYNIGIAGNVFRKKRKKIPAQTSISAILNSYDRDKDGVPDSLDACPDVPGLKQFNGCADRDGDGIPDNEDKCVTVSGVLKYNGCPVPDRDGDGINDDEDSCRTVPGILKYYGCPVPDTDGDGINDEEDKCLLQPGPAANRGCPVLDESTKKKIESAAKNIFFKTGSYELLPASFQPLNDVAHVLKANPSLQLLIEGHTDKVGTAQKNQLLSENRAKAVMDYLILKNGINKDRLSVKGYGFSKPISTNKTSEGRALNRRVELSLFY